MIKFTLKEKNSENIDFEKDRVNDVVVKLESVSSTRAKVFIKKLSGASLCVSQKGATSRVFADEPIILGGKEQSAFGLSKWVPALVGIGAAILLVGVVTAAAMNGGRRKKSKAGALTAGFGKPATNSNSKSVF
jgi:hypothetical protein